MTVIIPKQAYWSIVAACVRFANQRIPKDEWVEASGIFLGKNEGNDVIITGSYPIMHEHFDPNAIIDKYVWSDEDYISTTMIEEKVISEGRYDEFIVGWWHSHPGFKVMLSGFGDRKTTMSYQSMNPLAIALVFNPVRLIRQVELAEKKGDPDRALKNDPGFKIFRLSNANEPKSEMVTADYEIQGFDSPEQMVKQTQKFIIDITNFFPKDKVAATYKKFITQKIDELESQIQGTQDYLITLVHKGEGNRVKEVLENQMKDINKFMAETYIKIENIKDFMEYLEWKERQTIIPQVEEVLAIWDQKLEEEKNRLADLEKKAKKPKKLLKLVDKK